MNDVERTVKFYVDALELKVARRNISPRGAQIVFLATPNSDEEIEICQMPPGAPAVAAKTGVSETRARPKATSEASRPAGRRFRARSSSPVRPRSRSAPWRSPG